MRDLLNDLESGSQAENPMSAAQGNMRPALMKRFYKDVEVAETEGGFGILLDGRSIKTPGRSPVTLPALRIAEATAAEWRSQKDEIDPVTMPLTRLINSASDGVEGRKTETLNDIISYAGSDLLCYRADSPEELVIRQSNAWDPIILWAKQNYGLIFVLAEGVMPVSQASENDPVLTRELEDLDPLSLAATHLVVNLTGSALLAFSLLRGFRDAPGVWEAAHVDELFNEERWGADREALDARAARYRDFLAAAFILRDDVRLD